MATLALGGMALFPGVVYAEEPQVHYKVGWNPLCMEGRRPFG